MQRLHFLSAVLLAALTAGCSSLPSAVGDFIQSKAEGAAEQQAEAPVQNAAEPAASDVEQAPMATPAAVSAPAAGITPAANAAPAAKPVPAATTVPAEVTQTAPAAPAASAEQPQQKRRLQDQLINTKVKVETAAEAFAEIKRQSQTQGFSPNPDITRAMRRAEMSLQAAEASIEKGEVSEATESLKIAEASANQVLRAAGSL